jgi:hypothetical protein
LTVNQKWEEPLDKTKPFDISKHVVWEAYLRVRANRGAAGIDEQSITDFERELKKNLYKIWNPIKGLRFSSSSNGSARRSGKNSLIVLKPGGAKNSMN